MARLLTAVLAAATVAAVAVTMATVVVADSPMEPHFLTLSVCEFPDGSSNIPFKVRLNMFDLRTGSKYASDMADIGAGLWIPPVGTWFNGSADDGVAYVAFNVVQSGGASTVRLASWGVSTFDNTTGPALLAVSTLQCPVSVVFGFGKSLAAIVPNAKDLASKIVFLDPWTGACFDFENTNNLPPFPNVFAWGFDWENGVVAGLQQGPLGGMTITSWNMFSGNVTTVDITCVVPGPPETPASNPQLVNGLLYVTFPRTSAWFGQIHAINITTGSMQRVLTLPAGLRPDMFFMAWTDYPASGNPFPAVITMQTTPTAGTIKMDAYSLQSGKPMLTSPALVGDAQCANNPVLPLTYFF